MEKVGQPGERIKERKDSRSHVVRRSYTRHQ